MKMDIFPFHQMKTKGLPSKHYEWILLLSLTKDLHTASKELGKAAGSVAHIPTLSVILIADFLLTGVNELTN